MAPAYHTVTLVVSVGRESRHARHQLSEGLFERLKRHLETEGLYLEFGTSALGVAQEAKKYGFEE
jgi:hypothetical protein